MVEITKSAETPKRTVQRESYPASELDPVFIGKIRALFNLFARHFFQKGESGIETTQMFINFDYVLYLFEQCMDWPSKGPTEDLNYNGVRLLYPDKRLKDWMDFKVQRLSLQAMGAYINLLAFMWKDSDDQCSIPDNPAFIAKVLSIRSTSWHRLRSELQHPDARLFVERDGKLISERLDEEAQKQAEYREKQSEAGKVGAAKRWQSQKGCHSNPIVSPLAENSSSSSSSSSNQTSSSEPPASPSVSDDAIQLTDLLISRIKANFPTGRLSKPENEVKSRNANTPQLITPSRIITTLARMKSMNKPLARQR